MADLAAARRKAILDKMKKARASGIGNNFRDGRYRVAGKMCAVIDGHKGMRFQATWIVMEAYKIPVVGLGGNGPTALEKGKAFDIEPNPVGSSVDWLAMDLDKEDQPGAGNVRRLIMDLFNQKDLSDDLYMETVAEMCDFDPNTGEPLAQPRHLFKGLVLDVETVRILTQKKNNEIVVPKWSHVPPESYDKAAIAKWVDDVAARAAAAAAATKLPTGAPTHALPAGQLVVPPASEPLLPPGAVQQPV